MMTSHLEEHSTEPARTGTVKASGAHLFYQTRGSGPFLMMLCGGGRDGREFSPLRQCVRAGRPAGDQPA